MQYRIEKNTVQETLLIPVYGRKMCTEPVSYTHLTLPTSQQV